MHIYIDESGSFACFPEARNSISCVTALVVPESEHDSLMNEYDALRKTWGSCGEELKGRDLAEKQFAEVVNLVSSSRRTFIRIEAIDIGLHTKAIIKDHQSRQAARICAHLGDHLKRSLVDDFRRVSAQLESLPEQLYVQLILLTNLVHSVIRTATILYSQIDPPALGKFWWHIDAKDRKSTSYEELWRSLVCPFLQAISLKSPMPFLKEGDYSYFARFDNPDLPSAPEHLRQALHAPDQTFSSFDVKKVMTENLEFAKSKQSIGIGLVDVLCNCFRRAVHNRLQPFGWMNFGKLIVRDPCDQAGIMLKLLSSSIPRFYPFKTLPYAPVIKQISACSRGCLIPG